MRWTEFTRCWGGIGLVFVLAGSAPETDAAGQHIPISELAHDQEYAAVANNTQDREYLVAWQNQWPGNVDIYGQRVREDGTLNGDWFAISVGPGDRHLPEIAYNDDRNEYLVVWQHDDGGLLDVRAWRVSADGQLLGTELTLGTGPALRHRYGPSVAYSTVAEKYLVVWSGLTQSSTTVDIEAQVVTGAGALDGVNFLIAEGTLSESHEQPDVAYNRSRNEFLVVWRHNQSDFNISARRVQGDGTPMFPAVITINDWANNEYEPRVAAIPTTSGFGKYMVVWQMSISTTNLDIYSRVVEGDGTPGTMITVASTGEEEWFPDVVGNESTGTFMVAWASPAGAASGLKQRELSLNNSLLGSATWISGDNAQYPALGADGGGGFLVAYDTLPVPANGRDIHGWMNNLLFSDDFESGGHGAWSAVVP